MAPGERRRTGWEAFWALLFPARCLGCRRRGTSLCARCVEAVPWLGPEVCPRCAQASQLGRLCGRCRNNTAALDGLRAACTLDGVVRQGLHDLKYRQARFLAELAADLLARSLAVRPLQVDVLVPVPLSPARHRERGYNQSELIAGQLAEQIGVPMLPDVLERIRDTPPQVGRSAAERRENVRGAFAVRQPEAVSGRRVALLDDVATTGSTLRACAEPLKAAGATRCFGLVVARER